MTVSNKGTILDSQLGTGTNTTATAASGKPSVTAATNKPGGGSAEGNRGGESSAANPNAGSVQTGTGFDQGAGTSEASARGISRVVALASAVVGLIVGGMFTLL